MQWSLTGQTARLDCPPWHWTLDMLKPRSGVAVRDSSGVANDWRLLEIHPVPDHACEIEDNFVRGSDLMVRYGQSTQDNFAFQIDYRVVPADKASPMECGFDVWLSVQTQLLDSHPMLEVTSQVPGGHWSAFDNQGQSIAQGAVAMLLCGAEQGQVAFMIHPSDQSQSELVAGSEPERVRLFGNFMEKGVIRRGRVRCLIGRRGVSFEALRAAYDDFAHSRLPLTT